MVGCFFQLLWLAFSAFLVYLVVEAMQLGPAAGWNDLCLAVLLAIILILSMVGSEPSEAWQKRVDGINRLINRS